MTAGLPIFLLACLLPALLYVSQPRTFVSLLLVGLFALVVVLWPAGGRRP